MVFTDGLKTSRRDGMQPESVSWRVPSGMPNFRETVFDERALAPTYPLSRAENLRVNGVYGLHMALEPASYRLQVVGVRDSQRRHPRFAPDVTAWDYKYLDETTSENQGA